MGPSLGQDSIDKGILSIIVGSILVILFMVMYYSLSGIVADIALFLNIILILGALAAFKATLTLPGIAGIVLTIGMAVDANVLIFERIREELRLGKSAGAHYCGCKCYHSDRRSGAFPVRYRTNQGFRGHTQHRYCMQHVHRYLCDENHLRLFRMG